LPDSSFDLESSAFIEGKEIDSEASLLDANLFIALSAKLLSLLTGFSQ
jgi:hypothetical protein